MPNLKIKRGYSFIIFCNAVPSDVTAVPPPVRGRSVAPQPPLQLLFTVCLQPEDAGIEAPAVRGADSVRRSGVRVAGGGYR